MSMDTRKVATGALLLLVSSAILLASGTISSSVPLAAAGAASLGMAAGSLLIGTADDGRPV